MYTYCVICIEVQYEVEKFICHLPGCVQKLKLKLRVKGYEQWLYARSSLRFLQVSKQRMPRLFGFGVYAWKRIQIFYCIRSQLLSVLSCPKNVRGEGHVYFKLQYLHSNSRFQQYFYQMFNAITLCTLTSDIIPSIIV